MKQNYSVPVRLSDDLVRKLIYISAKEGRTPCSQFVFMLRNNIAYYEKTKGKIPQSELNAVDPSGFAEARPAVTAETGADRSDVADTPVKAEDNDHV